MHKNNIISIIRKWVADRLGLKDEAAVKGEWWEIDLIIVILLGASLVGLFAWTQL
jgi:hypothetical protein